MTRQGRFRSTRSKKPSNRARRRFAAAAVVAAFAAAPAPAAAQIGDLTAPSNFVSLFLEGCVWTAPDFRDAALVFQREGLARSELVFDKDLYVGPAGVVSAVVQEEENDRLCRLVGQGVDEDGVAAALRSRLEEDFGALLVDESGPGVALVFRAPIAGVEATVTMVPAESSEQARAMLIATMPR